MKITCYGAGTIGLAWAVVFLQGGHSVTLYNTRQSSSEKAQKKMSEIFSYLEKKGLTTKDKALEAIKNARFTTDAKEALEGADFVQESTPEILEKKQEVFALFETILSPETVIASSTSGLLMTEMACQAKYKERFLIGHPYNPVYLLPLVEIVRGRDTSDAAVKIAKDLYTQVGKTPVVLNKEVPGFIGNRIQSAVMREAYDLVEQGVCSVADVDQAISNSVGIRWGIIGPHLTNEVGGGPQGFKGLLEKIGPSLENVLSTMNTEAKFPEGYAEKGQKGVIEAMGQRPAGTGKSHDELAEYMNDGIIHIMKFKGLL